MFFNPQANCSVLGLHDRGTCVLQLDERPHGATPLFARGLGLADLVDLARARVAAIGVHLSLQIGLGLVAGQGFIRRVR